MAKGTIRFKIKGSLCDLSRGDLEEHWDEISGAIGNPKYMCRKCARMARSKSHLCKPKRLGPTE